MKRLLSGVFAVLGQSTAAAKLMAKQTLRHAFAVCISYVNTRPVLRNRLKRLVAHFPWMRQRLDRLAQHSRRALSGQRAVPLELQIMTPRARQIYQDLKTAIENKTKGAA